MTVPLLTHHWRSLIAYADENPGVQPAFVPVAISVGLPRNVDWARRVPRVSEITPWGLIGRNAARMGLDEWYTRYQARLDRHGPAAIASRFEAIYARHPQPLVLLCWEVRAGDCHRGFFARWWERQTGQRVVEAEGLGPLSIQKAVAVSRTGIDF